MAWYDSYTAPTPAPAAKPGATPWYAQYGAAPSTPAPTVKPTSVKALVAVPTSKLAPSDQSILKSFQSLDQPTRNATLTRLMTAAKAGDAGAAHKLTYLAPVADKNLPAEQDYTDHSLGSTLYNLGAGIAHNVVNDAKTVGDLPVQAVKSTGRLALAGGDLLTGNPTAAANQLKASNKSQAKSFIGQTYGTKKPGDLSGIGAAGSFGLDLAALGTGGAAGKELVETGGKALVKTIAKDSVKGAAYGAGYGVTQSAQNNQTDLASILNNIERNAAVGGVVGGAAPALIKGVPAVAKAARTYDDNPIGKAAYERVAVSANPKLSQSEFDQLVKAEQSRIKSDPVQTKAIMDAYKSGGSDAVTAQTGVRDAQGASTAQDGTSAVSVAPTRQTGSGAVNQTIDEALAMPSKGDKQTAANLRTAYSGMKNEQIAAGNQLATTLKKIAPDEQNAIMWYREAGGDLNKLKQWAADTEPSVDPYRADIEKAINLSDAGKQVSARLDEYYHEAGQQALDSGAIKNIREDYNNARLYQKDTTPPSIKTEMGGSGLKTNTGHAKARVYDTLFDAIKGGKVPATTNASDLMSIHNEELAKVNASRALYDSMKDAGIGQYVMGKSNIPEGWLIVDSKPVHGVDASGQPFEGQQHFIAPANIAKHLSALTDPGFLNKIDAYRNIKAYQGLVKSVDLSLSLFHHMTETMQYLYQVANHPINTVNAIRHLGAIGSDEFNAGERYFAKSGGITSIIDQNLDLIHGLNPADKGIIERVKELPGAKQYFNVMEKNNKLLFGDLQRYLKVSDFSNKMSMWATKHPGASEIELTQAAHGYAKEVNAAYGGLNWEAMGITKTARQIMQLTFLAPDWLISNLSVGKYALQKGTAGAAARSNLATAAIGSFVLTEMANKAITGHFTDQNPTAHPLEVEVAPHVYISLFRGPIGELVKLASNVKDNGAEGIARYLASKGSPITRTAIGLAGNKNYYGQDITNSKNSQGKNAGSLASFLAQNLLPAPFGAVGGYKYATSNEATPTGLAATLSGLGRYSAPGGTQQRLESESGQVQDEMKRLNVSLGQPAQKQRGTKLTDQQYTELKKTANTSFNAAAEKALQDSAYKSLSDAEKVKQIKLIESETTKAALDSLLGKAPKSTSKTKLKNYTK